MPYAKFVDLGNAAGLDHVDVLRYYAEDPDIEQVFVHIEGLGEGRGRDLLDVARETVAGGTSVLAMKTGTSEAGQNQAESHTGSLMGEDAVFDGAFEQARIQRVADYTEAQVKSQALLDLPEMGGTGVGMITHHGAAAIMAMDAAAEFDLDIPAVAEETVAAVAELSPDWLEVENPLDLGPATVVDAPAAHEAAIRAALEDDAVDGLLLSVHIADPSPWPMGVWGHVDALEDLAPQYDTPVIVVPVGTDQSETRARLAAVENVLVLDDVRQAMNAFRTVYEDTAASGGGA
jgi:acyl-CoA synthetase (NDP forming)